MSWREIFCLTTILMVACVPASDPSAERGDSRTSEGDSGSASSTSDQGLDSAAISSSTGSDLQEPLWREVAKERGVDFDHSNGAQGDRVLVETMGGGGGFTDVDGDGDIDLILIDGGLLGEPDSRPLNRLLLNDGSGHFQDATERSGFVDREHGQGLAVGDIDNDGDPDLYVSNFGPDYLYLNRGDGTFEPRPLSEELSRWSASAIFFDLNKDSHLDLYVTGYIDLTLESHQPCVRHDLPSYCVPRDYAGQLDHLLLGDGKGGFEDVSEAVGLRSTDLPGRGLGVIASDYDDDGDEDLYVANDMDLNFLWNNLHDEGKLGLREEAFYLGAAASLEGRPEGGMGLEAGDFDADGDFDLFVTNFADQTNAVYQNESGVVWFESSYALGMGANTLSKVGFGIRLADFDLDGDLDLFVGNGHVDDNAEQLTQGAEYPQADQLFENRNGKFQEVSSSRFIKGELASQVARAVASGDIDGDGDLDLLVVNNGGTAMLLENLVSAERPRIGLHLEGVPPSNRDAYGAKVTVKSPGRTQVFEVRAGASYLATNDPRILVAIPDADEATVEIRWPSGREEVLNSVPAGSYHKIIEGKGVQSSTPFRR